MKIRIYLLSILLMASSSIALLAQATIGSDIYPVKGSLLDLKTEDDNTGGANSDKGLMLPRVALQHYETLQPLLTAAQENVTGEKDLHMGMTVYNTVANDFLCVGLHTWDGSVWQPALERTVLKVDSESNSFIIPPDIKVVDIPIRKAYDFWLNYKSPKYLKNGFNTTVAGGADRNIDLNTLAAAGATIEAELLWMDERNLVINTAPGSNRLIAMEKPTRRQTAVYDNGTPDDMSDDFIRIYPSCNSVNKQGNAVIVLKINNEVYWSWHLWFTDYNPNAASATDIGATAVTNGFVYRYNNTSVVDGNYVFMDRNLGSTSSELIDKRGEIFFQWGRKDPFPSYRYLDNSPRRIYNGIGNIVRQEIRTVDAANNLANSIKAPAAFYVGRSSSNTLDWFTSSSFTNTFTDRLTVMNDFLWNDGGQKTAFDPCPKGWRVPKVLNAQSPWFSTAAGGSKQASSYTNQAFVKGFQFTQDNKKYFLGNYAAAGYLSSTTQAHVGIATEGRVWTSSPVLSAIGASALEFTQSEISPWAIARRSHGYSVRCAQETNK